MLKYAKGVQELCDSKKKWTEYFPKTSPELLNILSSMLNFNPYFRPTAKDLLRNPIFRNLHDNYEA